MKRNDLDEVMAKIKNKDVIVFPMIWPIAYGDSVVIHQYIRTTAQQHKSKTIILIAPLNRPELKKLAEMNDSLDFVIDIMQLPEKEKDRGITITLMNNQFLNLSIQEKLTRSIISLIALQSKSYDILKLRYFPLLDGIPNTKSGMRIWENRAALWLNEKTELAKLVDPPENIEKNKSIVLHFREANYGEDARNVSNEQAQDIIDRLNEDYPDWDIYRIGDTSMTELDGCHNCLDASLEEQIDIIQKADLFIGCHSAPQMMALACSETPIICINYTAQETTREMGDNIAKLSYEPVGAQVKAIHYTTMLDADDNQLVPCQNHPNAVTKIPTDIEDLMESVKEVLDA